jgi:hypothetical protein
MAGYIPTNLAGGFSYSPVSYKYGSTSQDITGGLSFSLPLETVAGFTNASLTFASNNSTNAQGFLSGVIGQAQGNLGAAVKQSADLGAGMYTQGLAVQQSAIKKFYKQSFCFITTAVTQAAGKPDDCWELQALRKFRDEVLRVTSEGEALVKHYYDVAPSIVEALDKLADKSSVYNKLLQLFIYPALAAISHGDNDKATEIYTSLVHFAASVVGIEIPEPVVEVAVDGLEELQKELTTFFGD